MPSRYVIVGGGIVGLATAHRILQDLPDADVTVLEKETAVGTHQTGHNSGVIHAGVYYKPGSLKALLCKAGSRSMADFCAEHGIPVKVCGKLIVATEEAELGRLRELYERSVANGLEVKLLDGPAAREFEPHVAALQAMHVASTGITDFAQVCRVLAELLVKGGAQVRLGTRVTGIRADRVLTDRGEIPYDTLVNCAGLHADRVARLAGADPQVRIVPFRGEYYELKPQRRDLVNGLIYPVPDPQFPFLGVHFTAMIDGNVHAGPNAVLAFKREGYRWRNVSIRDLAESAGYRGMWKLGRKHWRYGLDEMRRSLSPKRFAASLARLVPEVTLADLTPSGAGVRAQAIRPDGSLVDDFLIVRHGRQVHVLNAPSPAATSSLEIAKHIVAQLSA
ncbi:hydroxyglutarate oxidase [Rhizocola hellebori]|uniref:Hydroxyglutarate oxidase n=1 Tax=Rhizocola hellebori TaxID=1392758 RepID=A0A8J3QGU1_9ACTN|nr:L-2-hydroxyglutarate oxidase [Rhizocola hellebori]GIH10844.1 hydroxyglutarate oxidase [Rhizocola hellebori]